jgi:hypothetical protein
MKPAIAIPLLMAAGMWLYPQEREVRIPDQAVATLHIAATIPTGIAGPGGDIDAGLGRVWVRGSKILRN